MRPLWWRVSQGKTPMKNLFIATLATAGLMSLTNCAKLELSNGTVDFTVGADENGVTLELTGSVEVSPTQVEGSVNASVPDGGAKTLTSDGTLDAEREAVLQLIEQSALAYGLDPTVLAAVGWIESRFRNVRNPASTAKGVMQFIRSTAKLYDLADPYDIAANIDAGARLMRDNRLALRKALGTEPAAWMLYLAHQQGIGGAIKLLKANGQLAANVVGAQEFKLNSKLDPDATAADFINEWRVNFEKAHILFSYE